MDSQEFIQQEIAAGVRMHFHQGVWWRQAGRPGLVAPALPFHLINPRSARPQRRHAWIGYSHLTPASAPGTSPVMFWTMDKPLLERYGMDNLNHANRKAVAKARRNGLTVSRIVDLESAWPNLREIAMSMADRTGYGHPAAYYRTHFEEWKQSFRREFSKPSREWWGVYAGGKMGAYMYSVLVDDTLHLLVTKVHSDFMPLRASDYLYFCMLEYARDLPGCRRVNTGQGRQSTGVDRFKAGHGFQPVEVGEYVRYNLALGMLLRCIPCPPRTDAGEESLDPSKVGRMRSLHRRLLHMAERVDPARGNPQPPEGVS